MPHDMAGKTSDHSRHIVKKTKMQFSPQNLHHQNFAVEPQGFFVWICTDPN